MARGRMLLTSISLSEQFADMPDADCRLIATWTIPHLDREGRVTASPRRLRALVCPLLGYTDTDVARAIDAMCAGADPLALVYTDDSGHDVLWFRKFRQQQGGATLDRESASRYGAPPSVPSDASHVITCNSMQLPVSRARASALDSVDSLPFSSPDPDPDAREVPATVPVPVRWQPPAGTGPALVALWPKLREGIDGQLDMWADAHPGLDFVQIAKEARASAGRKPIDDPCAWLSAIYRKRWAQQQADKSAGFMAEHAKRKAAEAAEARLSKQLDGPADARPIGADVTRLLAAVTGGAK